MKWVLMLSLIGVTGVAAAQAQDVRFRQEPAADASVEEPMISTGSVTPTVEMWFYEQALRRYNDPKVAVRAKAEYAAAQRQRRLAAQKWFGYSNARPTVTVTPTMTPYSPGWTANSYRPEQWRGVGTQSVTVVPRSSGFQGRLW